MTVFVQDPDLTIHVGDVRDVLPTLPAESVDCVATSPPFYGLRDYGVDHQIGLEATPDEWAAELVAVFRECRRILRPHGTLWVEVGDSYGRGRQGRDDNAVTNQGRDAGWIQHPEIGSRDRRAGGDIKDKDLVGSPWLLAFALRADGWYLRQCIVWSKPNAMPESVRDRCTTAHSYVFLLSKHPRYFFDADAIAEPALVEAIGTNGYQNRAPDGADRIAEPMVKSMGGRADRADGMKNARSVWTINEEAEEGVEWTHEIGSCRRCGGLRIAGIGSAPMTRTDTPDSSTSGNSVPTEPPTGSSSDRSPQDSRSTIAARTPDASTLPTSNRSPSETISTEATHQRDETPPKPTVPQDTNTLLRTLTVALEASGSALRVCVCESAANVPQSVWRIPTRGFPGAHFATWPEALAERLILAGCPEWVCGTCGKPRERIVEREAEAWNPKAGEAAVAATGGAITGGTARSTLGGYTSGVTRETVGWSDCGHDNYRPGTVLDPFFGAGTTGLVARRLGRSCVGVELNEEYARMAAERCSQLSLLAEI